MKALAIFVFTLSGMLASQVASAADSGDRPAGVEAEDWIPITDRLGFVVEVKKERVVTAAGSSQQAMIARGESHSVEFAFSQPGYLAIKTAAGWQRVVTPDARANASLIRASASRSPATW